MGQPDGGFRGILVLAARSSRSEELDPTLRPQFPVVFRDGNRGLGRGFRHGEVSARDLRLFTKLAGFRLEFRDPAPPEPSRGLETRRKRTGTSEI